MANIPPLFFHANESSASINVMIGDGINIGRRADILNPYHLSKTFSLRAANVYPYSLFLA
jgi:hypothetical protein